MPNQLVFFGHASMKTHLWLFVYVALGTVSLSSAQAQNWSEQGPSSVINGQQTNITPNNEVNGAIRAVAINPTNANQIFVATINGGIWRTSNGTAVSPAWTALTDFSGSLTMSDVRFDPTDTTNNTLVASYGNFSSYATVGGRASGILRSTDSGATWNYINGSSGTLMTSRRMHAILPLGNTIIASSDSNGGIFRSTNTGTSWTALSGTGGTGLPTGGTFDLQSNSSGTLIYTVVSNTTGVGGIYQSTNQGATWTQVNNAAIQAIVNGGALTNAKISIGPNDSITGEPTVFVSLVRSSTGQLSGLFRTTTPNSNPTNWQSLDIAQGATNLIPNGQGFWHHAIQADPNNNNLVYVGGDVRFSRVNAALASGSQASLFTGSDTSNNSTPHVDFRSIKFDANGQMVASSDGGIFRRNNVTSGQGQWTSLNSNLRVMEATNAAYDPISNTITAGFQDNGTSTLAANQTIATPLTSKVWTRIQGGDGGYVAIDPRVTGSSTLNTTSSRYTSSQNLGGLTRRTYDANNNQTSSTGINPTVTNGGGLALTTYDSSYSFIAPVATNNVEGGRVYIASTSRIFESLDRGATVVDLNNTLGITPANIEAGGRFNNVAQPNVLYVGGGTRMYGRSALSAAQTPMTQLASYTSTVNQTVTDFSMDPRDWHSVYVVTSSRNVWFGNVTDALASTWTNYTGNLAGFNLNRTDAVSFVPVAGDPNNGALVLGSGSGVYFTLLSDPSHSWFSLKNAIFPDALVFDLDYDFTDDVLLASTMGRGTLTLSNASQYFASITVPEPATVGLLGLSGVLTAYALWRRRLARMQAGEQRLRT